MSATEGAGTSWTGRAADLVFIAACLALVGLAVSRRTADEAAAASAAIETGLIGREVRLQDDADGPGRPGVVIAISSSCRFCTESTPFYRQLADAHRRANGDWSLTFVGLEDPAALSSYLRSHGVDSPRVAALPLDLGIRGTPTLLMIDGNGKVTEALWGKLSEAQEKDTLAALR